MKTINQSKKSRRILVAGIVSACAMSLATMAVAADDPSAPKVNIRYGDLNLATSQGAKTLYERLISASYAVCETYGRDANDNADPLGLQKCRNKVIADAVTKVGKPMLFAVYNERNRKPMQALIVTADSRK
jgi:UrcA family protein